MNVSVRVRVTHTLARSPPHTEGTCTLTHTRTHTARHTHTHPHTHPHTLTGPYYSAVLPGLWLAEGGQSVTGTYTHIPTPTHTRTHTRATLSRIHAHTLTDSSVRARMAYCAHTLTHIHTRTHTGELLDHIVNTHPRGASLKVCMCVGACVCVSMRVCVRACACVSV